MSQPIQQAGDSLVLRSRDADVEAVYRKIAKRVLPFLTLLFVMAWLDRYNVGFAKLQMVKDLGFSEAVYGFGAGIATLVTCSSRSRATCCSRRLAPVRRSPASPCCGASPASR